MARIMKTVYCDSDFEHDVEEQLAILMDKLQETKPEYQFDMDVQWDDADKDL